MRKKATVNIYYDPNKITNDLGFGQNVDFKCDRKNTIIIFWVYLYVKFHCKIHVHTSNNGIYISHQFAHMKHNNKIIDCIGFYGNQQTQPQNT